MQIAQAALRTHDLMLANRVAFLTMHPSALLKSLGPVRSGAIGPAQPCCRTAVCRLACPTRSAQVQSRSYHFGRDLHSHASCLTAHRLQRGAARQPTVAVSTHAATDCSIASLTPQQQEQIDVFISFLLEENQKYNLTGLICSCKPIISAVKPCKLLHYGPSRWAASPGAVEVQRQVCLVSRRCKGQCRSPVATCR